MMLDRREDEAGKNVLYGVGLTAWQSRSPDPHYASVNGVSH